MARKVVRGPLQGVSIEKVGLPSSGVAGQITPAVDTPTPLGAARTIYSGVVVVALQDNENVVNLVFDESTDTGLPLYASGSPTFVEIDDLSKVYIVVTHAGDGVGFMAT
jgi:hypothetical protein